MYYRVSGAGSVSIMLCHGIDVARAVLCWMGRMPQAIIS